MRCNLVEIEDRANAMLAESGKASPGPWSAASEKNECLDPYYGRKFRLIFNPDHDLGPAVENGMFETAMETPWILHSDDLYGQRYRDIDFIVQMRTEAPKLAGDVLRLIARVKELESKLRSVARIAG